MAPAKSDWQTNFTGTFEHGVDDKRRLQIPSRWRPPEAGFEFTLIQWPKGVNGEVYLLVLTPAQLDVLTEKINRMEREKEITPDQAASLRRLTFGRAQTVKLDTAGRVCLPEGMTGSAGISKQATLVGTGERFEIWAPERLQAKHDQEKAMEEQALDVISL